MLCRFCARDGFQGLELPSPLPGRRMTAQHQSSCVAASGLFPAGAAAEDPVGSRQGQARDERSLQGKGPQVLGLKVMHVALAAGSREDLDL